MCMEEQLCTEEGRSGEVEEEEEQEEEEMRK